MHISLNTIPLIVRLLLFCAFSIDIYTILSFRKLVILTGTFANLSSFGSSLIVPAAAACPLLATLVVQPYRIEQLSTLDILLISHSKVSPES
jgi:hypothetical protein